MARPKEVLNIKIQIWSLNLCMKVRQQSGCVWHQRFWFPCPAAEPLLNMAYYICPVSLPNAAPLRSVEGSPKRALHLCTHGRELHEGRWLRPPVAWPYCNEGFPKCSRIWESLSVLMTFVF